MGPRRILTSLRRCLLGAGLLLHATVGCAAPPPAPGTHAEHAPAAPLRVMSFNIRYGTANDGADAWPHRRDLVLDVLRDHGPDLAGLQEALRFQVDEMRAALPEYAEIGVGRADGREAGEYAAILYRPERLALLAHGTFWFSETPDVPGSKDWGNRITRICTWGRFRDRRTARAFYLFNVHLDHESQPSRERSAMLLLDRIGTRAHPDPVVVTGDFNAGERNPAILRLLAPPGAAEAPPPLVDTFRAVHPDASDVGTFNGFRGHADGEKIDYVLVTPDLDVLDAVIVHDHREGRYPSDHFPVIATLRLPDPGGR